MKKFLIVLNWTLVVILSLLFISSGYPKIIGGASMVKRFEAWGYGVAFMKSIGVLELIGGIVILIPKLSIYGIFALTLVMLGAIYTHMSTGIGGPEFALLTLVLLLITLYLKKDNILKLLKKYNSKL